MAGACGHSFAVQIVCPKSVECLQQKKICVTMSNDYLRTEKREGKGGFFV